MIDRWARDWKLGGLTLVGWAPSNRREVTELSPRDAATWAGAEGEDDRWHLDVVDADRAPGALEQSKKLTLH